MIYPLSKGQKFLAPPLSEGEQNSCPPKNPQPFPRRKLCHFPKVMNVEASFLAAIKVLNVNKGTRLDFDLWLEA